MRSWLLGTTLALAALSSPFAGAKGEGPPPENSRINARDGAVMRYIPPGPFPMGDDDDTIGDYRVKEHPRNNPRHTVTLSGYYLYQNLVTVAMYRKFCLATGRVMPAAPKWGWQDDHPIVSVSWEDAKAYCDWAGVRLPTEAQWEKAARGAEGRKFPWGNDFDKSRRWGSQTVWGDAGSTGAVGMFPSGGSPYGIQDMVGNVYQWCADWYDGDYLKSSPEKDPTGPADGKERVLRGGSWSDFNPVFLRTAFRGRNLPTRGLNLDGFRAAASADLPAP